MFGIGEAELVIIVTFAFLLFGPDKLPGMGRTIGRIIQVMTKLDLTKYGILNATEIIHNPSYEFLFEEETKAGLEGFEKGQLTELGAVNVMTGVYTGRSPKDKFFVMDDTTKNTIWWTSEACAAAADSAR